MNENDKINQNNATINISDTRQYIIKLALAMEQIDLYNYTVEKIIKNLIAMS